MTRAVIVQQAGPGLTVQDLGRPGWLAQGMSRGGAADRRAMWEGAALLGQDRNCAAIEMAGMGGSFDVTEDTRIALTGAPMRAEIDGAPAVWGASHMVPAGGRICIGPALSGVYGYLHFGGGIAVPPMLGGRGTHLAAGIGAALSIGQSLLVGSDAGRDVGLRLPQDDRFAGGVVRFVEGPQSALFSSEELTRFQATAFRRDARGNRMGVALLSDAEGFSGAAGLSILSDIVVPGDVQITGDGTPFILLAECQTTGGYPRIGTVLPCDLPRVAQAPPGAELHLQLVDRAEALAAEQAEAATRNALRSRLSRLVRDPGDIRDLLAYQLISGVTDGAEQG